MNTTAQECIAIIAKHKGISAEGISVDSTFDELALDSLDRVSVCFDLEEFYNIEIPESELHQVRTVRDMVDGIDKNLAVRNGVAEATHGKVN